MPRRAFGWIAVVLVELGTIAAISFQSLGADSPRAEAWRLARESIKDGETRRGVPKFIGWPTARETFPCSGRTQSAVPPVSSVNLLDESFHYSPEAAARMCQPLNPGTAGAPLDAARALWESGPKPPKIAFQFPDGAHLAAAFWNSVRRTVDPQNGKIVQVAIRTGDKVDTRRIRIVVPGRFSAESGTCDPPTNRGDPKTTGAVDVSLEEFFWVRLQPGERYNGGSCGDFAVLMAFHLVHKVRGRWLWTTFWWDPESKQFGGDRPRDFQGAGTRPRAWRNYAMDASFETTATIFNPWRIEERKDNCARCHAEVTVYKNATTGAQIDFDSVTAARNHFQ